MTRGSLVLALALLGCEVQPATLARSELRSGLTLRGAERATLDDHLVELLVHEGHVYVANSNYGLSVMRLDDEGTLTVTRTDTNAIDPTIRCTSLAIHRESDTLYCASDWGWPDGEDDLAPKMAVFDVGEPGQPRLLDRFELVRGVTRDLEVVGDRLLIHHFDEGLWTAAIRPDGRLDAPVASALDGNARISVGLAGGTRIATLFADAGTADQPGRGAELRLMTAELVELDRLALAGPALSLSADQSGAPRLVAALGSGGLALIDTQGDRLRVVELFRPPAVVTHGLLDGDRLFALTLSGAFGWTLAEVEGRLDARMFGFGPAGEAGPDRVGNMLHGVLHEGELITTDWLYVERWAIDPLAHVVELDVPRGLYVGPSGPIRWQARNVGPERLRVEFRVFGNDSVVGEAELEPGASASFEIADEDRPALLGGEPLVRMFAQVHDASIEGPSEPLASTMVVIVVRQPDQDPALGRPAPGDRFPSVALQSSPESWFMLPTPEGGQTIFFTPDCALMWPQLEDMAWLTRIDRLPREGPAIFISQFDVANDGFARRWGLWGARFGYYGPYASPEVSSADAAFEDDLYQSFFIARLPGDAMPTDYSFGADGIVRSVERMYRGPWTLRVAWTPE
ncbi:hypothetical protein ACNOYE_37700 [Nannocystaceae bacterium ST9]